MKIYLLALFLLLPVLNMHAQDYHCLPSTGDNYYTDGIYIRSTHVDTVVNIGSTTVYRFQPTMFNPDSAGCLTRYGPSWLGYRMISKPSGDQVFLNLKKDSVIIKTLALPGEEWVCYDFASGGKAKAFVVDKQEVQFLGISDSVKTIGFQVYNVGGNPVPHPLNDMELQISKGHGMVKAINFKLFPNYEDGIYYEVEDHCHEYALSGMEQPGAGVTNLTPSKVYDLDVGDEFHTQHNEYFDYPFCSEVWRKYHVLSKEFNASSDSVIYSMTRCTRDHQLDFNYNETTTFDYDTVTIKYDLNEPVELEVLPDEVVENGWGEFELCTQSYHGSSGLVKKRFLEGFYSSFPEECIFVIWSDESKEFGNDYRYYVERLGGPYYHHSWTTPPYMHEFKPVYYKTGESEWGNPLTFNCDSLQTRVRRYDLRPAGFLISPNPMYDRTSIKLGSMNQGSVKYQLINSFGSIVREGHLTEQITSLDREGLPSGLYFIRLEQGTGNMCTRKLVIH